MNQIAVANAALIARMTNVIRARNDQVHDLLDAQDCPAEFIEGLGALVGLTPDRRITHHFPDVAAWRRAIGLAPILWAERGGHDVIRDAQQAFPATRSSVHDWHNLRVLVGWPNPGIQFPWFATPALADFGDWYSYVHAEDLQGTLDRDFSEDAVDEIRKSGEVVWLTFVAFTENWDTTTRWGDISATALVDGANSLDLPVGTHARETYAHDVLGVTATWLHVAYRAIVRVPTAGRIAFRVHDDLAGAYYEARLLQVGANNVQLYRSGALVAQATHALPLGDAWPDLKLWWCFVTIESVPQVGPQRMIRVLIDNVPEITYIDVAPLPPGAVRFESLVGTCSVDWFEVMPANPETRTIPS